MKGYKDLRQGDLISSEVFHGISDKICLLELKTSCELYFVLLSQDCDIVHNEIAEEPFLEFIVCSSVENCNGNLKNGKNPRKLQLIDKDKILEFLIHDRVFVKKSKCSGLDFNCTECLDEDNIRILKKWVAKRYTRSAFPDEFNNRIYSSKKFSKIASKEISEHISHVFFDVEDVELIAGQNYHLNVLIVTEADENIREKIDDAYTDALDVEGVELQLRVVTEDEVTLSMLRTYKRWEKDSYSLHGEDAPLDEIDTF